MKLELGAIGIMVAFGCVGEPAVGTVEQGIINGSVDNGHPSVGQVFPSGCSATLIGKRTVLTAAHCVGEGEGVVFCGDDGACMGGVAYRHPSAGGTSNDVATIRLGEDFFAIYGTVPTRVASSGPAEGSWITIVGFGCTECEPAGTKHQGPAHIDEVNPTLYQFDGSNGEARICDGDSGGPAFTTATSDCQVGIHSHRQDFWHGGDDIDMRADVFLPWVRSVANDASVLACNQHICGDGICHSGEYGCDCPPPPQPYCGDGMCNGDETPATCGDCYCGDGICSSGEDGCGDCCSGPGTSCTSDSDCCSAPCMFPDPYSIVGECGYAQYARSRELHESVRRSGARSVE